MPPPELHDIHSREIRVVVTDPTENVVYSASARRVMLFSDPPRFKDEPGLERLTSEKRALGIASKNYLPPLSINRSLGQFEGISGFSVRPSSEVNQAALMSGAIDVEEVLEQARFDAMFGPIILDEERYMDRVDLHFIQQALRHKHSL